MERQQNLKKQNLTKHASTLRYTLGEDRKGINLVLEDQSIRLEGFCI